MRLRRIVKENHGYNISQLGFFFNNKHSEAPGSLEHHKAFDKRGVVQRDSADTSNVLGTVGGCELSVYDNEHCGDHLDIMSNFDITPEDESLVHKHQLETFCWSYRDGDVLLATAGGDGLVHIISLANSEEIMALQGHKKTIYDLQSHPHNDNMILSTSKDGTMRLWDIHSGQCLVVFEADATVACFDYSGTKLISGGSRGDLRLWNIPSSMNMMDDEPIVVEKRHSRLLKKLHGDSYID
ncbi:WD40-repeat-containing domain protein, partial [Gilbertella persicaria]|uniref:WD40-repeat-containing domain protein n=1 Tax=Gilbertella persicaria TaxID=101096 RepID=UPI00221F6B13